jgi:NAD(P)-dependent dehydrogenase (short-subunit alcohol dehydrogenase family)
MDVQGRVALVTGASRGIGQAIALRLAEAGADVAVGYGHDQAAGEQQTESIRRLGRRSIAVRSDVRDPRQVIAFVEQTEATLGPVDILVSNAGISQRQSLEEISIEEWDRMMQVNVRPAFLLAQRVVPGMRERRWGGTYPACLLRSCLYWWHRWAALCHFKGGPAWTYALPGRSTGSAWGDCECSCPGDDRRRRNFAGGCESTPTVCRSYADWSSWEARGGS